MHRFPTKTPSGKTVFYYRTYDGEGNRTTARSTGQKSRSAAKAYCENLRREGTLIPQQDQTFTEYAEGWWQYDKCRYIKSRLARGGSFSRRHADQHLLNLNRHILPYFGEKRLSRITAGQVEKWLFTLPEKGLANTTANHIFETLRIMMNEAARLELIRKNPVSAVKPLRKERKKKGILSPKEVERLLFPLRIEDVWSNHIVYICNYLAASTGMRLGEVQALQVEDVFPSYVLVRRSLDEKYGLKDTKTHTERYIPLPSDVSALLLELKNENAQGFLFSHDGGKTPVYHKTVRKGLYAALKKIGITEKERSERNISFHSWRHYFNTTMRSQISDSKLRSLTGHATAAMTEHYTSFSPDDFSDVKAVQDKLFSRKRPA